MGIGVVIRGAAGGVPATGLYARGLPSHDEVLALRVTIPAARGKAWFGGRYLQCGG